MASTSSFPNEKKTDRSNDTSKLLNRYYNQEIYYTPSEVDAVIGYFQKRGFDQVAAVNTAAIILQQAGVDKIPVFELIDTLKGINDVQLSNVIAQILNLSRSSCSTIGYKIIVPNLSEQRNIIV
jgi:hypothetical protein